MDCRRPSTNGNQFLTYIIIPFFARYTISKRWIKYIIIANKIKFNPALITAFNIKF